MYTVLEVKTEEFLKYKNIKILVSLSIKVMTSSHELSLWKTLPYIYGRIKVKKVSQHLDIIMKIDLTSLTTWTTLCELLF